MLRKSQSPQFGMTGDNIFVSFPSTTIIPDAPGFSTLLWDNAKTTGAYSGLVVGGVAFATVGVVAEMCMPHGAEVIASIVGAPVVAVGATVFSVPFAISAQQTREFRPNTFINPVVKKINDCNNINKQQSIIAHVIRKNNEFDWFGVQSLESSLLVMELKNKKTTTDKWKALTTYMNEKSGDAYIHNGKKVFNAVLDTAHRTLNIETVLNNDDRNINKIKSDLTSVVHIIQNKNWSQEGWTLFGDRTPKHVQQLREYLNVYNISSSTDINGLDNHRIIEISNFLKTIDFGSSCFRGDNATNLYYCVNNIGNNTARDFSRLQSFMPTQDTSKKAVGNKK